MMTPSEKILRYEDLGREISAVLYGEVDLIARMATISNILHHAFPQYYWTGFYLVDPKRPKELVVGPYQGSLGCLRIPFGKGVCGAVANSGTAHIVEDVHAFPGHIACDVQSQSEIVLPVHDETGALIAVFDVDSDQKAQFDDVDREGLEAILTANFS